MRNLYIHSPKTAIPPNVRTREGDWRNHAACLHTDPELWYSSDKGKENRKIVAQLKEICNDCSVRVECLASSDEWGIWSGLTEYERNTTRGKRRIKAAEYQMAYARRHGVPPRIKKAVA